MMRNQVEESLIKKRSAQLVEKAYHELKEKAKAENEVEADLQTGHAHIRSR